MSEVYFWKRHSTSGDFVIKARELKLKICRAVANANAKQYGVYGAGKLVEHACELQRLTVKANFKPSYEKEVLVRYQFLILARQEFYNVVSQFADTSELMQFSDSTLAECSKLMEAEEKLLNGVIDSDRKKYAKYLVKLENSGLFLCIYAGSAPGCPLWRPARPRSARSTTMATSTTTTLTTRGTSASASCL